VNLGCTRADDLLTLKVAERCSEVLSSVLAEDPAAVPMPA
jgi:hypothetical protein